MTGQSAATLLGLLASFLFALAAFYQQRAARQTRRTHHSFVPGMYAVMATLVRDRVWLVGWVVNLLGFGAQALALHAGSVASVQPLLATQLMFALPLTSREKRRWPRARDWGSAGAICAGLVLLLAVVHARPLAGKPDRGRILLAAAIVVATILVVVPISARLGDNLTNLTTAGCAGLCFAMTAVFIKLTADDLTTHGVAYTARDWVGYALACSTFLGLVLEQAGFANGPLPWAVATKESVNPIASYAIGVLAFPISLPTDAGSLAVMSGAGLLLIVGAIGLAESPSAALWSRRPAEPGWSTGGGDRP